jgi:hypothetical protein
VCKAGGGEVNGRLGLGLVVLSLVLSLDLLEGAVCGPVLALPDLSHENGFALWVVWHHVHDGPQNLLPPRLREDEALNGALLQLKRDLL